MSNNKKHSYKNKTLEWRTLSPHLTHLKTASRSWPWQKQCSLRSLNSLMAKWGRTWKTTKRLPRWWIKWNKSPLTFSTLLASSTRWRSRGSEGSFSGPPRVSRTCTFKSTMTRTKKLTSLTREASTSSSFGTVTPSETRSRRSATPFQAKDTISQSKSRSTPKSRRPSKPYTMPETFIPRPKTPWETSSSSLIRLRAKARMAARVGKTHQQFTSTRCS